MANGDKWMIGFFVATVLYCSFCLWILLTYF